MVPRARRVLFIVTGAAQPPAPPGGMGGGKGGWRGEGGIGGKGGGVIALTKS